MSRDDEPDDYDPPMTHRQARCLRALRVPATAYIHYRRSKASEVIAQILAAQNQSQPHQQSPEGQADLEGDS